MKHLLIFITGMLIISCTPATAADPEAKEASTLTRALIPECQNLCNMIDVMIFDNNSIATVLDYRIKDGLYAGTDAYEEYERMRNIYLDWTKSNGLILEDIKRSISEDHPKGNKRRVNELVAHMVILKDWMIWDKDEKHLHKHLAQYCIDRWNSDIILLSALKTRI